METVSALARELAEAISGLPFEKQVEALNAARQALHEVSPFRSEPVDLVLWVPCERVQANDYNPNVVAPPEMKLLSLSILADGYTQPVVGYAMPERYEVVDGFHRHRVGREDDEVRARVRGHLPIVRINDGRTKKADRIAATVRHNRARGKHTVDGMADIVVDLARRKKSDEWIAKHLGMDVSEVIRLKQVTGLAELFAGHEFSEAWEADDGL